VCGANFDGDAGYYKCHRRKEGCDSRSIRQETMEQAVLGVLFEQYLTVETLRNIRQQLVRLEATTGARHKRDIEGIGAQLKDITRQIETLIALLINGSRTSAAAFDQNRRTGRATRRPGSQTAGDSPQRRQ
jgi:hypothetical protein